MQIENLNIKAPYIYKIIAFCLAVIIIFNSNSIWITVPGKSSHYFNIIFFSLIILVGISFFVISIPQRIFTVNFLIAICVFFYILIYAFQPVNISDYAYVLKLDVIIMFTLLYYALYCNDKLPRVMQFYVDIVTIIGIISLLFWILGSNLHLINTNKYILSTWSSFNNWAQLVPSYFNIYFEPQQINGLIRNSAIFPEAPMASLHFTVALSIEWLLRKNDKFHIAKLVILIICIISTFSSTGYIAVILLVCYKILLSKNAFISRIKPVIIVVVIVGIIVIQNILSQKLVTESGSIRIDDYVAAYNAWKDNPIMGLGIASSKIQNYMSLWRGYNLGFSNTIMDILAHGGIYVSLIYVLALIYSIKESFKYKNWNMLMFIIIVIYLLFTTLFTNTLLLFNVLALIIYGSNIKESRT